MGEITVEMAEPTREAAPEPLTFVPAELESTLRFCRQAGASLLSNMPNTPGSVRVYTTSAGAGLGTTVESKTERVRAACEHRNMPCEVIDLNNEPQRRSELISEYGEPLAADIELPQIYLGEQLLSEGFAEFQTLLDDDKLPNPEELRLRARRELAEATAGSDAKFDELHTLANLDHTASEHRDFASERTQESALAELRLRMKAKLNLLEEDARKPAPPKPDEWYDHRDYALWQRSGDQSEMVPSVTKDESRKLVGDGMSHSQYQNQMASVHRMEFKASRAGETQAHMLRDSYKDTNAKLDEFDAASKLEPYARPYNQPYTVVSEPHPFDSTALTTHQKNVARMGVLAPYTPTYGTSRHDPALDYIRSRYGAR